MTDFSKVIIVAGGSIDKDYLKEQLKIFSYSFIVGVDKGLEVLKAIEIVPNLMIGDFDSATSKVVDYFQSQSVEVIKLNPIKDDTDMEFAIRESIRRYPGVEIVIFGGSGTRLDHTFANMELLHIGYENEPVTKIMLLDPNNKVTLLGAGTINIVKNEQYGRFVSLLCYTDEVKGLTLKGMKYNLEKINIQKGTSLCISNEIIDETATIDFDEGMMYLVEALD